MQASPFDTHEVTNQPPPFAPCDLWAGDIALREAVEREGGNAFAPRLAAYGALAGGELLRLADEAHRDRPRLRTYDRFGHRIDRVEFNAAYHEVMEAAIAHGVAGLSWHEPKPGSHVARAALGFLHYQAEPGSSCPLTMTHAAVPVLRREPALGEWAGRAIAPHYDGRDVPMAEKRGVTVGMGMTEKQGGSDVRSNTTRATPLAGEGEYALVGHKWFFSAPMCDAFLILAQAPGGLTCFFLPRVLPDGGEGAVNTIRIQRLKDKLGNHANASSEVEFIGAMAWRVGEEGRGVAQILEMGTMTRLDCALGTSGLMRQALSIALHHTRQRSAFGKKLIEQPLMRNVLADLALESEAATALSIRLASAFDHKEKSEHEAIMARLLTPVAKFWVCKRGSVFAQEAMECLGGNGYVEEGGEGVMARIYREMPLNSIWEGAGNIMALDLMRAVRRADAAAALDAELAPARGAHPALDRLAGALPLRVDAMTTEAEARRLAQDVALAVQAALLLRSAPGAVFRAFCDSRLSGDWGYSFGTLGAGVNLDAILARALPA